MSRSKHQTVKRVADGQSNGEITVMFAEGDHDAMELVAKRRIKAQVKLDRAALNLPDAE